MGQKHDPITRAIKHGDLPPTPKRFTKAECGTPCYRLCWKAVYYEAGGV